MTMISSYYAKVGVGVDNTSLKTVDAYLKKIEKQLKDFQGRVSKKQSLQLNFKINQAAFNRALKQSLLVAGQTSTLRIGRVTFDKNAINKAMTQAMGGNIGAAGRPAARIGARLSQESLRGMRDQIRQQLSNITIRPNINPRMGAVAQPRASLTGGGSQPSGRQGRSLFGHTMGPNGINPYLSSGLIGSFMRFGVFALPGVAGAMGLNALTNQAMTLQSQRMALDMTAGTTVGQDGQVRDGGYYQNYLDKLGERVGKRSTDLMPDFTQMLAAARGTALEGELESSFAGLVQYASVMGLSEDQMKRSTRA